MIVTRNIVAQEIARSTIFFGRTLTLQSGFQRHAIFYLRCDARCASACATDCDLSMMIHNINYRHMHRRDSVLFWIHPVMWEHILLWITFQSKSLRIYVKINANPIAKLIWHGSDKYEKRISECTSINRFQFKCGNNRHTQHDVTWRTITKKKNMTRYEQKKCASRMERVRFCRNCRDVISIVWRDEIPTSLSFSSNWQNIRFIYYLHLLVGYIYLNSWVRSNFCSRSSIYSFFEYAVDHLKNHWSRDSPRSQESVR